MDHAVGQWLMQFKDDTHINSEENQHAAILVEFRRAFFLPYVIRNAMRILGNKWNLYVFHGTRNAQFLQDEFKDSKIVLKNLGVMNLTPPGYSHLMTQPNFWRQLKEEFILTFQLDSILRKPPPDWVWKYAMVGAPCGVDTLNGGLCTRLRSKLLWVLAREKWQGQEPEDVFFTRVLRQHFPTQMPSLKDAASVFTESHYLPTSCGLHGTDKCYLGIDKMDAFLRDK